MNNIEFSNEFDILYANIMSGSADLPGLNEYDKSVFLTQAQEELVKNYFSPKANKYQEGIDGSTRRQVDFSELMKTGVGTLIPLGSLQAVSFDRRAKAYVMPTDVFLIVNEMLYVTKSGKDIPQQVIPLTYQEYNRLMSKPYKEPLKNQAWRIIANGDNYPQGVTTPVSGGNDKANLSTDAIMVEIITHTGDVISDYIVRYVARPVPIILINLGTEFGDLSINGYSSESECILNPIIHRDILKRAVELAKLAYQGDLKSTVEINQRND